MQGGARPGFRVCTYLQYGEHATHGVGRHQDVPAQLGRPVGLPHLAIPLRATVSEGLSRLRSVLTWGRGFPLASDHTRCSDAASDVDYRGRGDAAGGRVMSAVPLPTSGPGLGPPLPHLHRLRPTHRRACTVGGTVRTHWIPCRAEVSWQRACDSIQHETCRTAAHLMHWRAEVSWRMATLSFPSSWFSRRRAVWHPIRGEVSNSMGNKCWTDACLFSADGCCPAIAQDGHHRRCSGRRRGDVRPHVAAAAGRRRPNAQVHPRARPRGRVAAARGRGRH